MSDDYSVTCLFVYCCRLRKAQMKEASEMKYGDQVEGVFICATLLDVL